MKLFLVLYAKLYNVHDFIKSEIVFLKMIFCSIGKTKGFGKGESLMLALI